MKYIFFAFLLFLIGCQKPAVPTPNKVIDSDQMINIYYDLALLEAAKSQNLSSMSKNNIDPEQYVFQKYKIDSLQFAQNNKFYAVNVAKYKRMYKKVAERIEDQKKLIEDKKANTKIKI